MTKMYSSIVAAMSMFLLWGNHVTIAQTEEIIGGDKVTAGTYPWFARHMWMDSAPGCGGSLVAPEYVLTAAHCLYDFNYYYGYYDLDQYEIGALCPDEVGNCGQDMVVADVESIHVHPGYDFATYNNDFALVKLTDRVAGIDPVKMDLGGIVDNYTSDSRNLYAIGFGNQATTGAPVYPEDLWHVEVAFVPESVCADMYGFDLTPAMMCAADPGQDSCQGDSGGPLYDANADTETIVGITSWGIGCAHPNYPGVYSKISNQRYWIKTTICNGHSDPKPDFCFTKSTKAPKATRLPKVKGTKLTKAKDSKGPKISKVPKLTKMPTKVPKMSKVPKA